MKFKNIAELLQYIIETPENEMYEKWVEVFNAMAVHTRKAKPVDLLLSRRPNEETEIFEYRLANYEAITYGSMGRALNNLHRTFAGLSYSIQGSEQLLALLKENAFNGFNFKTYMEQVVLTRMIEDPNGVLLWVPFGEGLQDETKSVNISPALIYSSQIVHFDEYNFVYKPGEKAIYNDANGKEAEGDIFHAYNREGFYKFIPIEEKTTGIEYEIKLIYSHKLNRVPAVVLGGNLNAENYYDSFFSSYLAFGNEAIRQFSDWQAIMVTSAFPYREELATECNFIGCQNGYIINGEMKSEKCPSCHGIGLTINKSPYGVYVRSLPNKLNESTDDFSVPSLRFISPDVSIVEYSQKAWETLIQKAEKTLALNYIDEAQSGTAKEIDREELYALLTRIGNNFFDSLMLDSLKIIEGYINIKNPKAIHIIKPFDFRIKSEAEIIAEIASLINNKAPAVFVSMSVYELAKKKFDGNPLNMKIFEVIMQWDKLAVYNGEEKINMTASGSVSEEIYTRSIYAYPLIIQLVSEVTPDVFMEMKYSEIETKLNELIKPYLKKEIELKDENGEDLE